jgi:hypothetical protein
MPSPAAARAALAGRYRSAELDAELEVVARADRLVLRIRDREVSTLVPTKEDEWELQPPDPLPLTLTATRDAADRVTGLALTCGCDGFRTLRLVRVP